MRSKQTQKERISHVINDAIEILGHRIICLKVANIMDNITIFILFQNNNLVKDGFKNLET